MTALPHSQVIACRYHVCKLLLSAGAGLELVGHGLVALVPRVWVAPVRRSDDPVLARRRHLHNTSITAVYTY